MTLKVHVIETTSDPVAAPEFVGQHWVNTSTGRQWLANDTSSISDWAEIQSTSNTAEFIRDTVAAALTDSSSIDFSSNDPADTITATVLPAGVDHDQLANFVANEHINHASVNITAGTGLSGGGDITASRTLNIANTGVTAATYGSTTQVAQVAINAQGQITSASNITITPGNIGAQPADSDLTAIAGLTGTGLVVRTGTGTATTRTLTAGTGTTVTNGDGVSGNPTVAITNTGVTAGTYGNNAVVPQITVNAQGQITSVASSSISIGAANITDFAEQVDDQVNSLVVAGTGISKTYNDGANTLTIANTDTGSAAVTTHEAALDPHPQYLTVTEGNAAYQPLDSDLTAVAGLAGTGLMVRTGTGTATTRFIAVSTGLFGSQVDGVAGNPTIGIGNTGVTAATYGSASQVPQIAINAQGQATSATNVTITPAAIGAQPVDADLSAIAALGANGILVRTGPGGAAVRAIAGSASVDVTNGDAVAGSPTLSVLPAGVNHDALQNFVANEHIDHSSVSLINGTGISATGLGNLTASRTINLANTGVTAASYGSATQVPVLTINAQGQITAASTAAVIGSEWQELVNTATLTNSSNSTLNDISDLGIAVVAGGTYRVEAILKYRSAAAGTGLALSVGLNGGATGVISFTVTIPTSTTAVATGHLISTGTVITATATPAANTDYVAQIFGVFTCTGSGTLVPQFRSETSGTTVTIQPGSNIIAREWV
jgi:hypothetical protein